MTTGYGVRAYAGTVRRPVILEQGPYLGVRDSLDHTAARPDLALQLINVYPQDTPIGGALVGRPGFQQAGAQLASGGRGQRIVQFTRLDGTTYTAGFFGGRIFTFNWSTRAWAEVVTVANLTTASITLSATARIYCAVLNDLLIVSDGVNLPFSWDGTAGAGGLTSMTNCQVLYGQPTIYYARLFGIPVADRTAIIWSEVNAPNTGYEAGGFNNAWTLGQTDQNPLFALRGTNTALYYWRAHSIGQVLGAVTDEFATTGTHDSISLTTGTTSPDAIVQTTDSFFFPDSDGLVQRLPIGGGLVEPAPGYDAQETTRRIPRAELPNATGCHWTPGGMVMIGVAQQGSTENDLALYFDAITGQYSGVARGYQFVTLDMVQDASLEPVLMHSSTDGYANDHGQPDGSLWSDAGVAIEHVVESAPFGWDTAFEKHFDRLDIAFRVTSNMTGFRTSLLTPSGRSDQQTVESISGSFAIWGEFEWGEEWGGEVLEEHAAIGWDERGRWARVKMIHDTLDERFGLLTWRLNAFSLGAIPETP
jgi:hypothetical protein